jgi:hypothetical protein
MENLIERMTETKSQKDVIPIRDMVKLVRWDDFVGAGLFPGLSHFVAMVIVPATRGNSNC